MRSTLVGVNGKHAGDVREPSGSIVVPGRRLDRWVETWPASTQPRARACRYLETNVWSKRVSCLSSREFQGPARSQQRCEKERIVPGRNAANVVYEGADDGNGVGGQRYLLVRVIDKLAQWASGIRMQSLCVAHARVL
jgi:hypothetical protein